MQRGNQRDMLIMIKKRKDRSTYKKRQNRSAGSRIYATKKPAAICPATKNKMGTFVTDNRVIIESIGMSAKRLNLKLPHHPEPLKTFGGEGIWVLEMLLFVKMSNW